MLTSPLLQRQSNNQIQSEQHHSSQQKTRLGGFFFALRSHPELLQLGFLVHDMLACLGIVFLHFELFRRGALVLGRGVEMTGTGT